MSKWLVVLMVLCYTLANAQTAGVTGIILLDKNSKPVSGASVKIQTLNLHTQTDDRGRFTLQKVPFGNYELDVFYHNYQHLTKAIVVDSIQEFLEIKLVVLNKKLDEVTVTSTNGHTNGIGRLNSIEGLAIYEAKKNELIKIADITSNLSTNNARQIFNKVPGLNIWESDQAGLQLGVGGRGLSPNRTSNFNTRQNGYDISADALGYPESYYTPPVEAIEQIEVVRGAASLQYGTQFGGMLNFVFKKGPTNKKIEVVSRQTLGSFGFYGSFNSIGGTVAKGRLNYFTFYNHKQGDGWRPNSQFDVNTFYASAAYALKSNMSINVDYTFMQYNAKQPGGLTDAQFAIDPRVSYRNRNWFKVNWNLLALTYDYKITERTKFNIRNFGMLSQRLSLGNLERINVVDLGGNRTLIQGDFANVGSEMRLLHHYKLFAKNHSLLVGLRLYYGTTISKQGNGSSSSDADYRFLNPEKPEASNYTFTNKNISLFAENIFRISKKISVTPGIRGEYISTGSSGYYGVQTKDFAGNVIADTSYYSKEVNTRSFVLAGIGVSYKYNKYVELYANFSQNYRAVNFNDLRIVNPNLKVDANMKDESGFSSDIGVRGNYKNILNYDVTVFLMAYNDRIGQVLRSDMPPLYQDYRFRTNVADSRNSGVEIFAEVDVWKLARKKETKSSVLIFTNVGLVNAVYVNAKDKAINNKQVEMAPPLMLRGGVTYKIAQFSVALQGSYVQEHYTDATNAVRVAGAVNGVIPSYQVFDASLKYTFKRYTIETSCNNLLNQMYFTRRAEAYPGPGIIPADGRSFYVTLGIKI